MDLTYAIRTANEFAEIFWPLKKQIELKDILLYGSTIMKKENPVDIDIMLIHNSPELDIFQKIAKKKNIPDIEKLILLDKILSDKFDLQKKLQNTNSLKLISQNLLNLNYINEQYFKNKNYKINWDKENVWDEKNFLQDLNKKGQLWNPIKKEYNIPTKTKYNFIY